MRQFKRELKKKAHFAQVKATRRETKKRRHDAAMLRAEERRRV